MGIPQRWIYTDKIKDSFKKRKSSENKYCRAIDNKLTASSENIWRGKYFHRFNMQIIFSFFYTAFQHFLEIGVVFDLINDFLNPP